MTRFSLRAAVAALVLVLVATAGAVGLQRRSDATEATLRFTDATGLYVGNDVQTIGVRIGEVTAVEPRGTSVDVRIRVDQPVPADVGALIMQSSLVTDRFVELTPAWTDGPRLQDGAVVGLDRTKAPANVDDVLAAVDDLLVALSDTTKDGKDVGDLLAVGADQLRGKGDDLAALLDSSNDALATVGDSGDDLTAIVDDLDSLTTMLSRRDATLRSLTTAVADGTAVLADQRDELVDTLATLDELSRVMTTFIEDNRDDMTTAAQDTADVLRVIASHRDELRDAFNTLPLTAENIARAYDPVTRNLRVRLDVRRSAPFGANSRSQFCRTFVPETADLCERIAYDGDFVDQLADGLFTILTTLMEVAP